MKNVKLTDKTLSNKYLIIICFAALAIILGIDFLTRHSEWDQAVAYQRAVRMLNGEIPFKDFFLLYLPLSVYLNSLVLQINNSFLTIKFIGIIVCLYILFTTYFIPKQITASTKAGLASAIMTYFFALRVWPESNYSWYSVSAILTMLLIVLQDYNLITKQFRFCSKSWLFAGVFLGISFCLKHNFATIIGVAISLFLIFNTLLTKGNRQKSVIYAFAGLILGLVAPLLLMIIYLISNHLLTDAYKDIVLGASSYVEFMKFSYFNNLIINPTLESQSTLKMIIGLSEMILKIAVVICVPLVGPCILIYSFLNRNILHRQLLSFLGSICSASLLFLFPRSDYPHLAFVLPILFVGTVVSFSILQIKSSWKHSILSCFYICLLLISFIMSFEKIVAIAKGDLKYVPISASFVEQDIYQDIQLNLNVINQIQAEGKTVVILDPSLSLYYPYLKISNPLRYDFPTEGNFGVNKGSDVIEYIKSNSNICIFVSKLAAGEVFFPSKIVKSIQSISNSSISVGRWNIYCR